MLAFADPDLDNGPRTDRSATMRMCAVTREVRPIDELIRFVVSPTGEVIPDLKRKLPGRGLWVAADRASVDRAARKGLFARAANGNVLETWYSINGAWGGWINIGGSTSNDPAAIAAPPGGDTVGPDVLFRDELIANNGSSVAVNWFEPTTGHHGGWGTFFDRPPTTLIGPPVLVPIPGRPQIGIFLVDIFLRGTDGRIYQRDFETFGESGQGWVVLAGSTANPPDAVGTSDGNDQVVTTSGGGAAVDAFDHENGATSGWRPLQ